MALGSRPVVTSEGNEVEVQGHDYVARIDGKTGLLSSLEYRGREFLQAPLTPNLWRAPTDNDYGNYMQDWAAVWEQASRNIELVSLNVDDQRDHVVVTARYSLRDDAGQEVATWQTEFVFGPYGYIHVSNEFSHDDDLPLVPRVGMNVELQRSFDNVQWFGRGPFETTGTGNSPPTLVATKTRLGIIMCRTCGHRKMATKLTHAGCRLMMALTQACLFLLMT